MAYIKTDKDGKVNFINYQEGGNQELTGGYSVGDIPIAPLEEGYRHDLYYTEEKGFFFVKSKVPKSFDWYVREYLQEKEEQFEEFKDFADMETLKDLKKNVLKEKCTSAIHDGFNSLTVGKSFGFNEHDQANFTQQLLIIVAANGNYAEDIHWKALDGSIVKLTVEEFLKLIDEASAHKKSNQEKYWKLEAQVLLATTKEEVISITW